MRWLKIFSQQSLTSRLKKFNFLNIENINVWLIVILKWLTLKKKKMSKKFLFYILKFLAFSLVYLFLVKSLLLLLGSKTKDDIKYHWELNVKCQLNDLRFVHCLKWLRWHPWKTNSKGLECNFRSCWKLFYFHVEDWF